MLGFVRLLVAIDQLYQLGFELCDEDFEELTTDMYESAWRSDFPRDVKLYRIRDAVLLRHGRGSAELLVCDDEEKGIMLKAVAYVNREAAKAPVELPSFKERLLYVSKSLPKWRKTRDEDDQAKVPEGPAEVIPLRPRP